MQNSDTAGSQGKQQVATQKATMQLNESITKSYQTTKSSMHKHNPKQQQRKQKLTKQFTFEASNLDEVPEFTYISGTSMQPSSGTATNTKRKPTSSKTPSAVKTTQLNYNKQQQEAIFQPNTMQEGQHEGSCGDGDEPPHEIKRSRVPSAIIPLSTLVDQSSMGNNMTPEMDLIHSEQQYGHHQMNSSQIQQTWINQIQQHQTTFGENVDPIMEFQSKQAEKPPINSFEYNTEHNEYIKIGQYDQVEDLDLPASKTEPELRLVNSQRFQDNFHDLQDQRSHQTQSGISPSQVSYPQTSNTKRKSLLEEVGRQAQKKRGQEKELLIMQSQIPDLPWQKKKDDKILNPNKMLKIQRNNDLQLQSNNKTNRSHDPHADGGNASPYDKQQFLTKTPKFQSDINQNGYMTKSDNSSNEIPNFKKNQSIGAGSSTLYRANTLANLKIVKNSMIEQKRNGESTTARRNNNGDINGQLSLHQSNILHPQTDPSPLTAGQTPLSRKKHLGMSRDRSPFLFNKTRHNTQEKIGEDLNIDKFQRGRSKSIPYLMQPPSGNLNLYLKSTRMNHVVKQNNMTASRFGDRSLSSHQIDAGNMSNNGGLSKLRKGVSIAQISTVNNVSCQDTDMLISRYMDVHNNKITELLGYEEKQNVLSKYLRMRNKLGLNYLKPEIEGLGQELENEKMKIQDAKKQLIRQKEDNVMTRMQNDEIRRQIGRTQKEMKETQAKRVRCNYETDNVYNDLFVKNDTMKLYDKTIEDLTKAVDMEKQFHSKIQDQIKELRNILSEEQTQRDEYKGLQTLQRKQIETLGIKHDRSSQELERNLTNMNEQINDAIEKGHISIKQLERNTKNMTAAQQSQFYMSKYASKIYSSMNNSKFNLSRAGFENKSIMDKIQEEEH